MSGKTQRLRRAVEERVLPSVRLKGRDTHRTLAGLMEDERIPAVSIAVMHGGRIDWAAAYGVREADGSVPVDTETLFQAASMSKMVAAFLTMQQVEAGVLDLDQDVNAWLSGWRVPDNDLTRQSPVTLRQILSHRAGLTVHGIGRYPANAPIPSILDLLEGRSPALNGPVCVDILPGSEERYSGGGTTILQLLLEELSGKPFAELAEERLFRPLGLSRSTFEQPLPESLRDNAARGHLADGSVADGWWVGCPSAAAGGLWTTPSEYAGFFLEICRALDGESELLGAATAEEMLTRPGEGFFALGPRVKGSARHRWFNHGGFHDAFKCEAVAYPGVGEGAVVMASGGATEAPCWEILNGIAAAYGWQEFLQPEKTPLGLPEDELERYVGEFGIVSGYEPGDKIVVWVEQGRLRGRMEPLPPIDIYLSSRDELFSVVNPYTVRVSFGPDGQAQNLTVTEDGVALIRATRIPGGDAARAEGAGDD